MMQVHILPLKKIRIGVPLCSLVPASAVIPFISGSPNSFWREVVFNLAYYPNVFRA